MQRWMRNTFIGLAFVGASLGPAAIVTPAQAAKPRCEVINPTTTECSFSSWTTTKVNYHIVGNPNWELWVQVCCYDSVELRASNMGYPYDKPQGTAYFNCKAIPTSPPRPPCTWTLKMYSGIAPAVGILRALN